MQSIVTVSNTDEIFQGIIHLQNNDSTLIFELPSIIRLPSGLKNIVTASNTDEIFQGIIHLQNNDSTLILSCHQLSDLLQTYKV